MLAATYDFRGDMTKCSTVAVTGGSGFVGCHLVDALLNIGKRVLVVDLVEPNQKGDNSALEYRSADLRHYEAARSALEGAEIVFHLAGNASGTASVKDPLLDFQCNAVSTNNVANASISHQVKKLVYLSSAAVYGVPRKCPISENHPTRPFLPYGASKRSGELMVLSLNASMDLPVTIGRSTTIYGSGGDPRRMADEVTQFLRWHLNGRVIPTVGDVSAKARDFIHVNDVVAAMLLLADRGCNGGVYNVGTGIGTSMLELANLVSCITGRTAQLNPDVSILDDSYRLVLDITELTKLGFRTRVSLQAGVRLLAKTLGMAPELPSTETAFRACQVAPVSR